MLDKKVTLIENINAANYNLTQNVGKLKGAARLSFTTEKSESFTITLSNNAGEKILIGYDKATNTYFIDRKHSGKVNFEQGFAAKHLAPRISGKNSMDITVIIDNASVELFADNGLSVMTAIFFPGSDYTDINISSLNDFKINKLKFNNLKSIWR